MIVYVESNFVLELAYLQQEHGCCSELLRLSESGDIGLALPAFCIGEPYEAWVRRRKKRERLHGELDGELRELSRSRPYEESPEEFRELASLLVKSVEEEKSRLNGALERTLETVEVLSIGPSVRNAIAFQETLDLSPQDSIIFASILHHLTTTDEEMRCFITKDKDFANPDIQDELSSYNCKFLAKYTDGLGYIRSQL